MKYFSLVWAQLFRSRTRTLLTLLSVVAAFLLFGMLDSVRTMTATVAIELGEVAYGETHYFGLFAIGLVLFVFTFAVNMIADTVLHRYERKVGL